MSGYKIKVEDIIEIAKEAGKIVMQFYKKEYSIEEKKDKSPVTEADIAAHNFLVSKLSKYKYPIISEEGSNAIIDFDKCEYNWIIDPLDGTSDFIGKTDEFSVMIGLVKDHKPVLGVVYEPAKDVIYWAEKGRGAFMRNDNIEKKLSVTKEDDFSNMTILLSRNHLLDSDEKLYKSLGIGHHVQRGSTSKVCVIARGDAEIYVNTSDKTSQWDTCATEIILTESGGTITDMVGKELLYNNGEETGNLRGFVASNGTKHDEIIKALKSQGL